MKKWLVSFTYSGKFVNKWIEFYGEEVNVSALHQDLIQAYGEDVCILNIFPEMMSDKKQQIIVKTEKAEKGNSKKKKSDKPEAGQNMVKISGPLPEELKHLIGLEGSLLSQEGKMAVVLTPAGLYPNIPINNLTRI